MLTVLSLWYAQLALVVYSEYKPRSLYFPIQRSGIEKRSLIESNEAENSPNLT